jgi:hypothetical protein
MYDVTYTGFGQEQKPAIADLLSQCRDEPALREPDASRGERRSLAQSEKKALAAAIRQTQNQPLVESDSATY